jgi:hypothetical protein
MLENEGLATEDVQKHLVRIKNEIQKKKFSNTQTYLKLIMNIIKKFDVEEF